ncbi:MAG: M48 family metallopeptidase [Gallionellaceae bacterium]|nr:M48 family metallopeptidase [Gallionellaceae bacterium]
MGIPVPEFKVLLYGPSLHPSGIRARARFEGDSLAVTAHKGFFLVPPHLINLRTGGFDGRQWLITWAAQEGTYSAMLQSEEALEAFIQLAPEEIGRQFRQTHKSQLLTGRRVIIGLIVLALLVLLILGLFQVNADRLSLWAVSHINQEQEEKLGDLIYAQMRPSLKVLETGVTPAAVRAIGKRLTAESNYHYQFHVVVDPRINAYALPGGHIVVYTGLINAASSAGEAAGVLAHEISHVEKRHALRNMVHALGLRAILGVALGNYSGGVWGNLAEHLGSLNYSRELESEADMEGLETLHRAGIAANGMETFFAKMTQWENATTHLLSRHPAGDERLAALRAAIARQPIEAGPPLQIDWEQIKSDLCDSAQNQPDCSV